MNSENRRQYLRQATEEAQKRSDQARVEIAQRGDLAPRPGDILAFAETAAHSVLWVVLERMAGARFLLVVADLHPAVGSADVASPAGAACGLLSLRCGFEVLLDAADFGTAERTGAVEPAVVEQARRKRAEVVAGAVSGSSLERDTDDDLVYQDWLEEGPAAARAALLSSLGERLEGEVATSKTMLMPLEEASRIAALAARERVDPALLQLLHHIDQVSTRPHLGLPSGIAPEDLAQAGWAVVFHPAESQDVRSALEPLVEHRRQQIGGGKTCVLEYRREETWRTWLSRHGVAAGQVEPAKVPYYLLLVGPPTAIPYEFERTLGIEYAVGRLNFEEPGDFRRYAESVLDAEARSHPPQAEESVFFAPGHVADLPQRFGENVWGGSLAMVGPVEGTSAGAAAEKKPHPSVQEVLDRLAAGQPVGHASKVFKRRYARIQLRLNALEQRRARGATLDTREVAALWSERNEMRGIVVVGDPAVRLRVD